MVDRKNKNLGTGRLSLFGQFIRIWLSGTVIFMPVKLINLPSNFELVDIWILMGLPAAVMFFMVNPRQIVNLSYLIPMWLVLVSSLLSSISAPSALNGLIVFFKETYLFVWFISVTILLYKLREKDLRFVLYVWSIVVILHGLLMVSQFLSPEIWRFTNSLGGISARTEGYRAAGLFICGKAGCANKAAYYQLVGFIPILLAGYSKRTTIILGLIVFISMLTTGSMAAFLAFSSALLVSIFTIAYFKKNLFIIIRYLIRFVVTIFLLGGFFYISTSQQQGYRDHFYKIFFGRFEKSSGGRFGLWQRGIDALFEHNAVFWGVGPENFRVVDAAGTDNQLHNDTLAFLVERGLIGVLGLALFAVIATSRAVSILKITGNSSKRARMELVVFLALIAATMFESLTHQMFRTRELWLVLAVQEAVYYQLLTSEYGLKPARPDLSISPYYRSGLLLRYRATYDG